MPNYDEAIELLKTLCAIPAPSNNEIKRAEFCCDWFKALGADAYIDEALNVIVPIGCENCNEITVIAAHTDTVFPDTEPFEVIDDGERIHCPAAGDDTANLVVMMLTAKHVIENHPGAKGLMFVCNSGEEGLGNLKGTRRVFSDFEGRIARFISYDSFSTNRIVNRAVGSERFKVIVNTKGGHSYLAFGNRNAIAELAELVSKIYSIEVPKKEGRRTTYNVGEISGGTSVNTIAQEAYMLCEYRSDDDESMSVMREKFAEIFDSARANGMDLKIETLGVRPTGKDNIDGHNELIELVAQSIREVVGCEPEYYSSSTDCNIPLSLGIPAVCFGTCIGHGTHTREEYVEKKSLEVGLRLSVAFLSKII